MNKIKRKKESEEPLLSYRFGIHNNKISGKLITTSKINKRITLYDFVLHHCLRKKQFVDIVMEDIHKYNLDLVDEYGYTPLHVALYEEHTPKFIKLLVTEKNVNMRNKHGNAPLHIALLRKYPRKIIEILITKENLKMKNDYRDFPSDISSKSGYPKYIRNLLKNE